MTNHTPDNPQDSLCKGCSKMSQTINGRCELCARFKTIPDEIRFWNKVDKSGKCWLWMGHRNEQGYGQYYYQSRLQRAHRVSYILTGHTIPLTYMLDHLCRNTSCVNPEHLEPVTNRENVLRGRSSALKLRREYCKQGHRMVGDNLNIIHYKGKKSHTCRLCQTEQRRQRYLQAELAKLEGEADE
jgi:hypothetical protein